MKVIVSVLLATLLFSSVNANNHLLKNSTMAKTTAIPFIKNIGQKNQDVKYYAHTFAGTVFITNENEIVYSLPKFESKSQKNNRKSCDYYGLALKESFNNSNVKHIIGRNLTTAKINYFNGKDKSKWKSDIPSYEYLDFGQVFEGINIKLRAYGNNVEKLFFVQPNGDPDRIKVEFEGADFLTVNNSGELEVSSPLGKVTFTKPVAYQENAGKKVFIDVSYTSKNSEYGFALGEYDKTKELIIDPLLASTFLGGSSTDDEYEPSMIIDDSGYVYITGYTSSTNFPTTSGSYDEGFGGYSDRFVSKFSNDMSTLIASTFIGGSKAEYGMGICIDSVGNVYLGGYTASSNFPTTTGAFDESFNKYQDAFIVKLNGDLSKLLASTYYGGNHYEAQWFPRFDMTMGNNGNVYVTGISQSTNLPMLDNSYSSTSFGNMDIFVAEFNPELSKLLAATYIGSPLYEWRPSILVDSNDNVFIGADAAASGYPTTDGAFSENYNGGSYDVVVSKFSGDLSTLLASTYIGTNREEDLLGMRLNKNNELLFTGLLHHLNYFLQ